MATIKRNLLYNFILSFSQVLLPLVSIPYVSRVLDPDGIGRVGFIDSFTYYFIIIAEFGITVYGIREVAKCKHDAVKLKSLVSELMTLHVLSSCVTLVLYGAGVFLLWNKIGDIRLLLFSVSFLLVNFLACEWYFMGMENFRFITFRSLTIRLLGLLSIFILVHKPADYYIYYAIIVLSAVITSIWNNVVLFSAIKISFTNTQWQKHLKYVWVTYCISLLYSIPLMLDNVLLRIASSTAAVGFYTLSVKVVRLSASLLTDSFLVFFPRVVALAQQQEQGQVQRTLLLNIQFITIMSIPIAMGTYLLADEIAIVVFGEKFVLVADNLRILALFPFLKGVNLFLSNPVLMAQHKEKAFLKNLLFVYLLFIPLAVLAGYYYGATGACVTLIFTEALLLLANYLSVKKNLPVLHVFDSVTCLQAIAGAALFIPVVFLVKMLLLQGWLTLVLCIAGCCLVYVLFFLFLVKNNFVLLVKKNVFRINS